MTAPPSTDLTSAGLVELPDEVLLERLLELAVESLRRLQYRLTELEERVDKLTVLEDRAAS